jgi:signal transduction histidine kinase
MAARLHLDRSGRFRRAYEALSGAVQLVQQARGEAELLDEACRMAVKHAGYVCAWVGYTTETGSSRIRPVAHGGCDAVYLESIDVTVDPALPSGQGPAGTAMRTGATCVMQDIANDPAYAHWRAEALARGYASAGAVPLLDGAQVIGVLNLYCRERDAFDPEEISLIEQVAAVVTHGVMCARGHLRLGKMEQELQRAERFAIAGRIAAELAHDVNNCLAIVLPFLERHRGDPFAEDARSAVDRAAALNKQLMSLARAPAATVPPVSSDRAIEAFGRLLQRIASPAQLSVALDAAPWEARIAPSELEQVLSNLVVNARESLPADEGGTIQLRTRKLRLERPVHAPYIAVPPGEYISIVVTDTGCGITPEAYERLFEPFFTTKGNRGSGIGLASVLGIAKRRDGYVFVETEVGRGSSFEIVLPRVGGE